MNFKPYDHHATLTACRECARLKLGLKMARTEAEREKWRKLMTAHRREVYQQRLEGVR